MTEQSPGRLIYWEASEGGAGVLRRLVEEPDALARVAQKALEICHFDPATGAEHNAGECARACYRCLLSYSNQPFHSRIDRRLVRVILMDLSNAHVIVQTSAASTQQITHTHIPPATQRVLEYIRAHGGREPDALLSDTLGHQPHLRYDNRAFILCPEPGESITTMRDDLEDAGYTVLVVSANEELDTQLGRVSFWRE